MRKKLIGVFLILLAALLLLQGYFVKWDISIWTLAWVTLLAVLSLSSFLKRHFGWGFIYGLLALFVSMGNTISFRCPIRLSSFLPFSL